MWKGTGMMAKILLTGGAGYIGSHTAVELLAAGKEIVIADDLSNSHADVLGRIAAISGHTPVLDRKSVV